MSEQLPLVIPPPTRAEAGQPPDLPWMLERPDPRLKRLKARAERKLRKRRSAVIEGIAHRTWEKAKRQAIEKAGGIG